MRKKDDQMKPGGLAPVDVAIIGAGPAGLAVACACGERGLSHVVLDRAGLAQSFVEYPPNLQFFSPPDEMEIADVPLPVAGGLKPVRETYLAYLRGVVRQKAIHLMSWHAVENLDRDGDHFNLRTVRTPNQVPGPTVQARCVIVATGLWHQPRRLGVPGEDLPHVIRELSDPTPYFGQDILVVGGGNSAVGGALILMEARARVALSMRRPPKNYRSGLRPFVKRDLAFAVEENKVRLLKGTVVREIREESAILQPVRYTGREDLSEGAMDDYAEAGERFEIPARFVFSLIGHDPDRRFLGQCLGLELQASGRPVVNAKTWETTRPGIFVAGSLADHSIDIVLRLREQAVDVVQHIHTSTHP